MASRSRAGLPAGPGPRSRSVARTRDNDSARRYDEDNRSTRSRNDHRTDYDSRSQHDSHEREARTPRPSARQIRPQKSMSSVNQGRSGSQPPPASMRTRHTERPSERERPDFGAHRGSDTSTSSAASSFLDRMRGYASSRTSLEEDESEKPTTSTRGQPARGASPAPEEPDTNGDGYSLWNRVASAAGSLTVNVSKAWATNVMTISGEETPPGQESRLTRAMKSYHIEKARDPTELPGWLFSEQERRNPEAEQRRQTSDRSHLSNSDSRQQPSAKVDPPSRGFRDIYDAAAASSSSPRSHADETSTQPSKATDRLKALRDAKRNGGRSTAREPPVSEAKPVERTSDISQGRRRVGLPSGPVSRRL